MRPRTTRMTGSMSEPIVTVNSLVPFGDSLFWWLGKTRAGELHDLIEHSRHYDRAYLAWELVRRKRNPFFLEGTGFEGYLIGAANSPDEALHHVLRIGEGMLRTMLALHRNDPRFRSRLMKALDGELDDPEAIEEWSAQLGAALARLRVNLINNPQAGRLPRQHLSHGRHAAAHRLSRKRRRHPEADVRALRWPNARRSCASASTRAC